jgi:hypothetical protein
MIANPDSTDVNFPLSFLFLMLSLCPEAFVEKILPSE